MDDFILFVAYFANVRQIVTRALGTLGLDFATANYTEVDCISNHLNICRVSPDSELYRECVNLLDVVRREAPDRIAKATEKCTFIAFSMPRTLPFELLSLTGEQMMRLKN